MGHHLLLVCRGRKHAFPTISGSEQEEYAPVGKHFLRLMMCFIREKVHNQFEELSPYEENRVRQPQCDERLKAGGSMNFGRGCHIWPVFSDRPPGKKESVADSVINTFLALLPSPPVSSADSFIAPHLPLAKAVAHFSVLICQNCASQADRRPSHVPEMTPALCRGCKDC